MEDNNIKMASEPAVAYPITSYTDVMEYIHSIHISREDKEKVAQRLTVEVTQPALAEAYDRIAHLSTLPKDWDGFVVVQTIQGYKKSRLSKLQRRNWRHAFRGVRHRVEQQNGLGLDTRQDGRHQHL